MKQDQTVQNIIREIVSHSRRSSLSSSQSTQQIPQQYEEDHSQQEYVIHKTDLQRIIHKLVQQDIDKNDTIQQMQQRIAHLQRSLRLHQKKIESLTNDQQNKTLLQQNKETLFKKCVEDLQTQYALNQQLQKNQKALQQQFNHQINQINRFKIANQTLSSLKAQSPKQNNHSSTKKFEKLIDKQVSTPHKEGLTKLDTLPLINCESIDYSASESPTRQISPIHPIKLFKTEGKVGYNKQQPTSVGDKIRLVISESQVSIDDKEISQFTELEKKDKKLRLLAQKCLLLQQQVQQLTRKLLGTNNREPLYLKLLQPAKYGRFSQIEEKEQEYKLSSSNSHNPSVFFLPQQQQNY